MYYLDTSAFLKLVIDEPETAAMQEFAREHDELWSSQLLVTEALRSGARLGSPDEAVLSALEFVSLVLPSSVTFFSAGGAEPSDLRSLDAIHLATALEMEEDLTAMVTYDRRLHVACSRHGITALSPG